MLKAAVALSFFALINFHQTALADPTGQKPEPQSPPTQNTEEDAAGALKGCQTALTELGIAFEAVVPVQAENNRCEVPDAVRISSVASAVGTINLPARPVLNCGFALRLSVWLSDVAAPVIGSFAKSPLVSVTSGPGFQCRNRNNQKTGKLSEHAYGNAIDITDFRLANGKTIKVSALPDGPLQQVRMLMALRISSCGYFTTVLGPGSSEAHKAHFHLDFAKRGKDWNYRICE
jgi:hypothetical protein